MMTMEQPEGSNVTRTRKIYEDANTKLREVANNAHPGEEAQAKEFRLDTFLYFSTLWKKKSTFLPYRVKKHHSTLEMDTFNIMLLLSYLASLDNKPRT